MTKFKPLGYNTERCFYGKKKRNSDYEKKIKEVRGIGEGVNYKPWIDIQDISSLGKPDRTKGLKTNRLHGFLSDLEQGYF